MISAEDNGLLVIITLEKRMEYKCYTSFDRFENGMYQKNSLHAWIGDENRIKIWSIFNNL